MTTAKSGVIRGSRVMTLVPGPAADSVWWESGRITKVGRWEEIDQEAPAGIPRYDCPGATITPGFVDSHTHFTMWALGRREVQLTGVKSLEAAVAAVGRAGSFQGWIVGQGWDANQWSRPPARDDLDHIPFPVFLDSLDVHAAWVNSSALAAAGISRETPDPPGGRIVRDASGVPTGLLLENAVSLVRDVLPSPPESLLLEATRTAQREAHSLGITGIHNVEGCHAWETFAAMETAGDLELRVLFHHPVAELHDLVRRGVRSGTGSEWLLHGGVKMFLDGSLGSRTAWMLSPYEGSRDSGMPVTDRETAQLAVLTAADAGLAAVVHAIGDAAVRRALDLIEPARPVGISHRIEHFQCVHPGDIARAARANIVLSMQPAHILVDIPLAERNWGDRSRGAYAFRSLLEAGSLLSFGSDTPVASIDPREGVFAAMERRQDMDQPSWYPEQRLDFETVVRAYTTGPAGAANLLHRRGTLAPGMDADLVAWQIGEDIFHGRGAAIRDARVRLTVVGGSVVYRL